jgi:hypothetical protein
LFKKIKKEEPLEYTPHNDPDTRRLDDDVLPNDKPELEESKKESPRKGINMGRNIGFEAWANGEQVSHESIP